MRGFTERVSRQARSLPRRSRFEPWIAPCLLVLVVLLGAALRLVALDRAPPGLHFDEAVYGLMAQEIVAGARPVYFPAYTGREPLYMYLMAVFFAGIGATPFAIRLTSAFAGIATIALAFALGRALFGRRVGLAAAAILAVSYWHLTVSRNGYPNILIPPIEAASAFWLWRGWRSGRARAWIAGGALAGLVLYTYLAARFYPVFLAALVAYAAGVDFGTWRRRLPGIALAVLAAALVFAPLGWHFWQHPEDFVQRANQVLAWERSSGEALARVYLGNLRRTLLAFVVPGQGDPRWHYNLPGRAIFQPALAVFFGLGLAICVRRMRDLRYAIPLLWIAVLAVPGLLTDEMQPAGQRIFGMFPALALVPAVGLVAAADALARWLRSSTAAFGTGAVGRRFALGVPALVAGGVVLADGVATARDYFFDWARRPETAHIFNADYAAMARAAAADVAAGRTVVLLSEHYKHPTVAFLAPSTVDGAVWAEPWMALPRPAPRMPADDGATPGAAETVYFAPSAYAAGAPAPAWLEANATRTDVIAVRPEPDGDGASGASSTSDPGAPWPDVRRYVVPAGAALDAARGVAARSVFAGEVATPAGLHRALETDRDETLTLAVDWTVVAVPSGARNMAVHLDDAHGFTWAQADGLGYLAEQWRPGDNVRSWFTLHLDRAMPPGVYTATLLVTDASGHPLPYRVESGGPCAEPADASCGELPAALGPPGGLAAPVARVRARPDGARRAPEGTTAGLAFADGLAALEVGLPDADTPPGGRLGVSILWARLGPAHGPDVLHFRLAASGAGTVLDLGRLALAEGYPPSAWREREVLRGRYALDVPAAAEAGTYTLVAARPMPDAAGNTDSAEPALALGTVRIGGGPRVFEPPPTTHAADAVFGGTVRLVGYDLDPARSAAGAPFTVTLVWQAIETPPTAGNVFVHLFGTDGRPLAQHDGVPAEATRPLPGWLPGEVVVDRHVLALPVDAPADLTLGIGVYDPTTGTRWAVAAPSGTAADDRLELPWSR